MKRLLGAMLGSFAITTTLTQASDAQEYPQGSVLIVVGFAPGSTDDKGAPGVASYLEKHLGISVGVDSRPGAGMQIALEHAWAKPHDGHTILWNNQQYFSTIGTSSPEVPYRTDQWVWREALQNDPTAIVVRSDSKWGPLQELIEEIKAQPKEITAGLLTGSVHLLACKQQFHGILKTLQHVTAVTIGRESDSAS